MSAAGNPPPSQNENIRVQNRRTVRCITRYIPGSTALRRGLPAVPINDLEAQHRARKGVVRRRVFRAGGGQQHGRRRSRGKEIVE